MTLSNPPDNESVVTSYFKRIVETNEKKNPALFRRSEGIIDMEQTKGSTKAYKTGGHGRIGERVGCRDSPHLIPLFFLRFNKYFNI